MVHFGCVRWQGGMRMACHSATNLVSGNYLSGDVYPMKSDVYLIVGICIFLHRCTCVAYIVLEFCSGSEHL